MTEQKRFPFFDEATKTVTYLVWDGGSGRAAERLETFTGRHLS